MAAEQHVSNFDIDGIGEGPSVIDKSRAHRLESLNAAQVQAGLDEQESFGEFSKDRSHLYPIAVLIDELRNEDTSARLNAIKRLSTIALALGPERTREELLPFVKEAAYDEDDILIVLVEQLGKLVPYLGGKEFAYTLLPTLESLSGTEEALVRDKTTQVLSHICSTSLPTEHVEQYFLPVVKRLASAQWFTSRCSSCGLFSAAYPHLSTSVQTEIRQLFVHLCEDDTPMVRRVAAEKLANLIRTIVTVSKSPESPSAVDVQKIITQELYPAFLQLTTDEQDSVRLASIDAMLAMAEYASAATEANIQVFPIFCDLVSDKSWRVRHVMSAKFPDFQKYFYSSEDQESVEHLVELFLTLLQDQESEVRTASAEQIKAFCEGVPETERLHVIQAHLLPLINTLVRDPNQYVKSAVAKAIMEIAPLVGKDFTIENLLPLFLAQLRDDSAEVRLSIISNLTQVDAVIGTAQLSQSLLPAVLELAEDSKWRIRLAIVTLIPLLAEQLGREIFEQQLADLTLNLLTDPVYAIREAAVINLNKLTETFETSWTQERVLPKLSTLSKDDNYLRRMTCLFTIKAIISGKPELIDTILSLVLDLSQDKIPNVRFNVAKCLSAFKGNFDKKHSRYGNVENVLVALSKDADNDVCYYAVEAQKSLGFVQ